MAVEEMPWLTNWMTEELRYVTESKFIFANNAKDVTAVKIKNVKSPFSPVMPNVPVMTPPKMNRIVLNRSICLLLFIIASIEIICFSFSLLWGFMWPIFSFLKCEIIMDKMGPSSSPYGEATTPSKYLSSWFWGDHNRGKNYRQSKVTKLKINSID